MFTLLNDEKRRKACLSCLPLICEKPFFTFSLYLFSTISLGCSEFGTISSTHDRDIRSPTFSKFRIYSSQSRDSRTFIFNRWRFNGLEFICKTHVCKQINVLLGPTKVFFRMRHFNYSQAIIGLANWCWKPNSLWKARG